MKKTRITAVVLACILAFSMTACSNTQKTETETETVAASETETETEAATESETETAAASETETETQSDMNADDLIGSYEDSFSQRASMTIEKSGKADMYNIDVHWSSSASEYTEWNFTCYYDAEKQQFTCDGLAYCNNIKDETPEEVYSDESAVISYVDGHFEIEDSDGALADCQFEKAE